ncbi:MAG: hypothetical protein HOM14_03580 [Gammaproteobacteria bacterium]|jgi:hypothetical protein|nr:hypothetical protein [Gammaproteobacteria bacterium]
MIAHQYHPTCKANSCPLLATEVTDYWPKEKKRDPKFPRWGLCSYHYGQEPAEWAEITRRIIQHQTTLLLLQGVSNITDQLIKPLAGERVEEWMGRVGRHYKTILLQQQPAAPDLTAFESLHSLLDITRSAP